MKFGDNDNSRLSDDKDYRRDQLIKTIEHAVEHMSLGELEALTGVGQPGLSQQLAILRKAELVQTRRDAKLVLYSLAPDMLENTAKLLCALAGISPRNVRPGTKGAGSRARGSAATFARIL